MAGVDLSEFEALGKPRRAACRVGLARDGLAAGEQEKLDQACAASSGVIATGAIVKWLEIRGANVSIAAVTTHRNKRCRCAQS